MLTRTEAWARVLDEHADAPLAAALRARMDRKYGWSDGWVIELELSENGSTSQQRYHDR